jgi:hypothetical protein
MNGAYKMMCGVLEIYYDADDSGLPEYVDPDEETTFLSQLPPDVVQDRIWPLIFDGCHLPNIQEVSRMRRVCKAWRAWVDDNDGWNQNLHTYLEKWLRSRRPWEGRLTKLNVALMLVKRNRHSLP